MLGDKRTKSVLVVPLDGLFADDVLLGTCSSHPESGTRLKRSALFPFIAEYLNIRAIRKYPMRYEGVRDHECSDIPERYWWHWFVEPGGDEQ